MTTDRELLELAREAGVITANGSSAVICGTSLVPYLERFASLVAAHEREACAVLAEDRFFGNQGELNHEIAAAIRARGGAA